MAGPVLPIGKITQDLHRDKQSYDASPCLIPPISFPTTRVTCCDGLHNLLWAKSSEIRCHFGHIGDKSGRGPYCKVFAIA